MGELYKGWHTDLRRPVAIKTLIPSAEQAAMASLFALRFLEEAKSVANVDSENVIQVLEYGQTDDGRSYIVMPFLEGEDLSRRVRRARSEDGRPLPVHEAIEILLGAARGVHACHMAQVIHRDLKPGNIFLTKDQTRGRLVVKVLDFGVSQPRQRDNDEATFRGLVVGTPAYMPPEQAMGMDVSVRSDEYALAAILYQCLTLHAPYDYAEVGYTDAKERARALISAIRSRIACPPPCEYVRDLPKGLEKVLIKALAADPADRYKDVYAFAKAIVRFASDKVQGYYGNYFDEPPLPIVMPQLSIPISADGWLGPPRRTDLPRVAPAPPPAPPAPPNSGPTLPPPPGPNLDSESLDQLVRHALAQPTLNGTPVNDRSTEVTAPDADLLLLAQPPSLEDEREPLTDVSPPDLDFLGISPAPVQPNAGVRIAGVPVMRSSDDRARAIIVRSTPWSVSPAPEPAPTLSPPPDSGSVDSSTADSSSNGAPSAVEVVPERGRIPTVVAIFGITLVATLGGAWALQRWRAPVMKLSEPTAFLRVDTTPREVLPRPIPASFAAPPTPPSPPAQSVAPASASASSPPLPFPPPASSPPSVKKRRHVVRTPAAERYDEHGILIPEADPLPRRPPWWKSWHLDQYGHKIATDRRGRMWRIDETTGRPGMEVDDHGIPMLTN